MKFPVQKSSDPKCIFGVQYRFNLPFAFEPLLKPEQEKMRGQLTEMITLETLLYALILLSSPPLLHSQIFHSYP